jgi:hypothetical protein
MRFVGDTERSERNSWEIQRDPWEIQRDPWEIQGDPRGIRLIHKI